MLKKNTKPKFTYFTHNNFFSSFFSLLIFYSQKKQMDSLINYDVPSLFSKNLEFYLYHL